MPYVTVGKENGANIDIYYKDWGKGQPIVFSHGWPLSADDWDAQLLFFLSKGYRVIAHDRRGHGRSTQVGDGHDLDHYADDLKTVTDHLNLKDPIHAADGEDPGQSARPAQIGVRRSPGPTLCQPGQVLLRLARRSVLRLQPSRRENDRAYRLELVAPRHDGRCQGAL